MNTRNYLSVSSPEFFYFTADLIRRSVISSLLFHFYHNTVKIATSAFLYVGSFAPCLFENASHKPSSVATSSFLQLTPLLFVFLTLPTFMFLF